MSAVLTLRPNLRRLPALPLAACLAALVASACAATSRDPDQDYKTFQTAATQAPREGYTPYWLGREFDAGSYTFSGPSVADFGDVSNGSLTLTYNARDTNGGFGLTIVLFSRTAPGLRPNPRGSAASRVTRARKTSLSPDTPRRSSSSRLAQVTRTLSSSSWKSATRSSARVSPLLCPRVAVPILIL